MKKIIIFASGSGTNAENIMHYFADSDVVSVNYVITNNKEAQVIKRAGKFDVPVKILEKGELVSNEFLNFLKKEGDLIILAGFLLKIPEPVVCAFPERIINIHPSLLPKYGGKGMYGKHVHEAVVANQEKESGITIHFVNEKYDDGAVIFQKEVPVEENDSAEAVAAKIHELEQKYFPKVIEKVILATN
ncbi:MAG: phosphoribosylglycinamide formyltransferase [Flavobacteriaceae bacterium]|nr:phosphoribosylglycinamide formyltransferase [Flavobacteriaceae bacterium]